MVKCGRCGLERVVPFSCKTRGLCSSCAGRRMADTAARLVDSVLPDVPYRQWVLSLPFDLRLVAAARADVLRHIVRIYVQTIFRGMRRRLRMPGAAAGAVAACHRAGGALNCNPHLHLLVPDGVFVRHPAGGTGFHRAPAPSPNDLAEIVAAVRRRVLRRLARMGLLRDDRRAGEGSNEQPELSAIEA
ncbi:MAG: transposase zinc-binding domain-containing protein, partial [Myxococcota bacterium]|nr:transposase zinc-binding domain-containing protein [Myxococcota bacterium]